MSRCTSTHLHLGKRLRCEERSGHAGFHGYRRLAWRGNPRKKRRGIRKREFLVRTRTERAVVHTLYGLLELGCIYLGEHETENLLLSVFGLPTKRLGETHKAWAARNGIELVAPQSSETSEPK